MTSDLLFTNVLAAVYNCDYHVLLLIAIISGILGTIVPAVWSRKPAGVRRMQLQTGLKGMH
jgi:hypothetical protein